LFCVLCSLSEKRKEGRPAAKWLGVGKYRSRPFQEVPTNGLTQTVPQRALPSKAVAYHKFKIEKLDVNYLQNKEKARDS
jgi:hypothetical protein